MNKKILLISVTMFSMFSQAYASSELLITLGEDDGVSIVDYNAIFSNWNNVANFNNPCYEKGKTERCLLIPNGSMVNFASVGTVGSAIRLGSACNDIPNPLGITHSGFIINDNPRDMFEMIINLSPGGRLYIESQSSLSEESRNAMLSELAKIHHDVIAAVSAPKISVPFLMESHTAALGELSGVHIHDFKNALLENDGNVYLRQLKTYISNEQTREFLKKYIGRSYEDLETITELASAITQSNVEENSKKVFCSELATLFYKETGVIGYNTILSNNVIPEMLSSGAGANDLLKDRALPDIPLKISFALDESENKIDSCWKWLAKKIIHIFF